MQTARLAPVPIRGFRWGCRPGWCRSGRRASRRFPGWRGRCRQGLRGRGTASAWSGRSAALSDRRREKDTRGCALIHRIPLHAPCLDRIQSTSPAGEETRT
ncbi:predicted protein [Streptomyces viridosporus ATCC 14672]|uniref:Predicted protein n=1 Tax=Streptomyces viridosporus (strain ATCC 14672 / DSM 40746 / JCM 4963 / KCTC 9882 / NRRL B-12104 / FH 1290) TaxID=566461 RepID=D5ZU46_STRV1|nr:predicted protein [Streptomyces viridosporus ATCC 14672]